MAADKAAKVLAAQSAGLDTLAAILLALDHNFDDVLPSPFTQLPKISISCKKFCSLPQNNIPTLLYSAMKKNSYYKSFKSQKFSI